MSFSASFERGVMEHLNGFGKLNWKSINTVRAGGENGQTHAISPAEDS